MLELANRHDRFWNPLPQICSMSGGRRIFFWIFLDMDYSSHGSKSIGLDSDGKMTYLVA